MNGLVQRLGRDEEAATAATVALSLVGLIAAAGIAFDYARMATLDTELQSAADQAAIAAATQLDGEDGACARAVQAAREIVSNDTRLANDGGGLPVTIAASGVCDADGVGITDDADASVRFFTDKLATDPAEDVTEARFVEVTVDSRKVNYALTPIVGAMNSGNLFAKARAGLGTALCKVPPLMICPPTVTAGTTLDWNSLRGHGIQAVANTTGKNWAPGAFGYIGPADANSTQKGLAFENPVFQCQEITGSEEVSPGQPAPAITALNTRFDIYDISGGAGNVLTPCLGTACPPALNVTKDLTRETGAGSCGMVNKHQTQLKNEGWHLPDAARRFFPVATSGTDPLRKFQKPGQPIDAMGLPRDNCHYTSYGTACSTTNPRFGNGVWARGDYFNKYHAGRIPTDAGTMTRYEVYRWEIDNGYIPSETTGTHPQKGAPQCNLTEPDATRDRRVVQVAVGSNCSELSGRSKPVQISQWVNMFLVEPGANPGRGNGDNGNEIYLEVIGTVNPGGSAAQVIRRDTPFLVK